MQRHDNLRTRAARWIESRPVQNSIVGLILINAVTLGMETSAAVMAKAGPLLLALDSFVLSVFVVELGLKLYAHGLRFFREPWNVFDFAIVSVALVPESGPFAVLRVLRILRALRLISMVPHLRFVVEALLRAIPGIAAIAALMLIVYYVFAVVATGLFGSGHPEWFGTIGRSMYTLFQVMTLESWSMGIVRPVMEQHPWAWAFFIPFILLATFTMLNLFIAIIVNTMQSMQEASLKREEAMMERAVQTQGQQFEEEMRALRAEVVRLRELLERAARIGVGGKD